MLSRLFGLATANATLPPAADAEGGFELVSAVVDGRPVIVFVAPQGTAAAVEMGEARALVLTGLAAGIVLSDVEEAANGPAPGVSAASSRMSRLSAHDAEALIEGLVGLTLGQKDQLRAALSL